MRCLRFICLIVTAAAAALSVPAAAPSPAPARPIRYGPPRIVCMLACPQITESSGLACSRRSPGVFWTHNDGGDRPHLYAFNRKGVHLGTYALAGVANRDWEDIASCTLGGKPCLLICDTGDNKRTKPFVTLHLVAEPPVDPNKPAGGRTLRVARTIHLTYEDGPQDCEAVAVDPASKTIYLVAKRGKRTVYELPMPKPTARGRFVAKAVAVLDIGQAVAMDISPDGLRAVVLTYGPAYEYTRSPGETWPRAFARRPRRLPMPGRRQGESICYALDGKTLCLTSEKRPTPLLEVPAIVAKPAK